MNNDELNKHLDKLNQDHPTDLQIHNWKVNVRNKLENKTGTYMPWLKLSQFAVTLCLGVAIGAFAFSTPKSQFEDFADDNATIEVIYTNL